MTSADTKKIDLTWSSHLEFEIFRVMRVCDPHNNSFENNKKQDNSYASKESSNQEIIINMSNTSNNKLSHAAAVNLARRWSVQNENDLLQVRKNRSPC